jgi:phage/plasmid-like protein (TIGR03299 family)
MSANVDTMAYTGDKPWHREGVDLGDKYVKYERMLAAAQQDWTVSIRELYLKEGQDVPNHFAIVRDDTGAIFGVVSRRYQPVQNRKAFEFLDEVVGAGQAVYHTAGSLGRGEKTWILLKLPQSVKVAGHDQIDNYLALVNSHDGKGAFQALWTPIRVVCENTLNVATRNGRIRAGYRLSHYMNIEKRMSVEDAREALGLAGDAMAEFAEVANKLAQQKMTDEQVRGFLQRLLPLDHKVALPAPKKPTLLLPEPKKDDIAPDFRFPLGRREKVHELINTGRGNRGETRWDALNGVVEFTDYEYGSQEHRARSTLFGYGRDLKAKAAKLLVDTDGLFRAK